MADFDNLSKFASDDVSPLARMQQHLAAIRDELQALQRTHLEEVTRPGPVSARERAQSLYDFRRARDHFFPGNNDLFGEPAWDILLDLFIAQEAHKRVSVGSACIGGCVSATTGLRWLTVLEQRGLVERIPDPEDGRRAFVRLTPAASQALRAYLETC